MNVGRNTCHEIRSKSGVKTQNTLCVKSRIPAECTTLSKKKRRKKKKKEKKKGGVSVCGLLNVDGCIWIDSGREFGVG